MNKKSWPTFHASHLKTAAIITMLIDHFAASLFFFCIIPLFDYDTAAYTQLNSLYFILRTIGRLAFPIFCFFIVEGLQHTKDVKKYASRLLIFGIVSEIPFNMAISGQLFDTEYQNVYFTLLIGLIVIALLDKLSVKNKMPRLPLSLIVIVIGMFAAWLLKTDYDALGVLVITAMYFLRQKRIGIIIVGSLLMLGEMQTVWILIPIAAYVLLLLFYDGKRGKPMKYFFYTFYPAHLLLFGILRMLLYV